MIISGLKIFFNLISLSLEKAGSIGIKIKELIRQTITI